ncbi:MAG TPA: aminotransferase class V-fold PLP-dependent enzyme [Candidatus Acidoferrum sp.]|nr:aminotransferase class V-fold PLP-dependent enzyme [Candidatus Acidoferrum sp.]
MSGRMNLGTLWNRRTFLGSTGMFAGMLFHTRRAFGLAGRSAADTPGKLAGFGSSGNVYEELGVRTVINAEGTMTYLGGSLPHPEVEAVMALAAQHFVPIVELEVAAGKRICELLKLPPEYDAIVTCGAAAGMQIGLSGILTGNNPKFIEQIPDLTGMKSEVIIQKSHRNAFDHQLRSTGAKLVVIESREDLKKAIGPQTAMMHFSNFADAQGQIKVDEWVKLAHQNNLPAFIDAAADTPPVSNLWNFAKMGYDLIAFSGGKAIRGPQCAGLLIGKKEFVANALLNNSPHEDTIGRSQKVGKEEIVGMVKALEVYLNQDQAAVEKEWWRRLDAISAELTRIPGVTTSYHVPDVANHVPHMDIFWDPRKISLSPSDVSKAMREGKPSIVIGRSENGLELSSFMLKPGEDKLIAARLSEILKSKAA